MYKVEKKKVGQHQFSKSYMSTFGWIKPKFSDVYVHLWLVLQEWTKTKRVLLTLGYFFVELKAANSMCIFLAH